MHTFNTTAAYDETNIESTSHTPSGIPITESQNLVDDSGASLKITVGRVQRLGELLGKAGLSTGNFVELGERMAAGKEGAVATELASIVADIADTETRLATASSRIEALLSELRAL